MMHYVTGSLSRRFAPFALALLITAGAQAASVSSTLTLTGTTTISTSGYVNTGNITLTNVGNGTFASTIPLSALTGSTVTATFTITLSGGTLVGSFTEPASHPVRAPAPAPYRWPSRVAPAASPGIREVSRR